MPELNVPVPSDVVPERKVTVPVAAEGETVAVSVTFAPTVGVVVDAVSVVVVAVLVAALTVTTTALDVLVASVVEPP
jgi:hypothetical protein